MTDLQEPQSRDQLINLLQKLEGAFWDSNTGYRLFLASSETMMFSFCTAKSDNRQLIVMFEIVDDDYGVVAVDRPKGVTVPWEEKQSQQQ